MFYEGFTLGLYISNKGSQHKSPMDPREPYGSQQEPIMANVGNLNPFWMGVRLLCVETLVDCLC